MADSWWYCMKHGVESEPRCPGSERMGPYGTREEAAQALQTAAQKTQAWDAEDERWKGDDED